MKETIKKAFLGAIVFLGTILFGFIGFSAYTNLATQTDGATITKDIWNDVINSINTIGGAYAPTGMIRAFNLSTCPNGRIAANGSNGTPDLRGEFIRGLDSGRGVDSGRTLASAQNSSAIASNVSNLGYGNSRVSFSGIRFLTDQEAVLDYDTETTKSGNNDNGLTRSGGTFNTASVYYRTIRPRNVAFLYCVKQ
ncbi:MAG: hypothetical protein PHR68_00200 [Candidatus Gracilibacteria bacterium]|nr:hypothetical protein [Candidatus Gracilibacteria bacterium]